MFLLWWEPFSKCSNHNKTLATLTNILKNIPLDNKPVNLVANFFTYK